MNPSFETLEPGDEIPTARIELSPPFVAAYAREIGMDAPRFTSPDGAKKEGLPGQIAPGNLTLALLARSLVAWAPHARLVRLGTTFRALALAGTTAHVQGAVTEKDEARRTVECDLWMENGEGDRLVLGTATVAFP
jgi:acyl dehydratase